MIAVGHATAADAVGGAKAVARVAPAFVVNDGKVAVVVVDFAVSAAADHRVEIANRVTDLSAAVKASAATIAGVRAATGAAVEIAGDFADAMIAIAIAALGSTLRQ